MHSLYVFRQQRKLIAELVEHPRSRNPFPRVSRRIGQQLLDERIDLGSPRHEKQPVGAGTSDGVSTMPEPNTPFSLHFREVPARSIEGLLNFFDTGFLAVKCRAPCGQVAVEIRNFNPNDSVPKVHAYIRRIIFHARH
jgi:hypothetical protein